MKELSLHILDIVQNSIDAGSNIISITINEDTIRDTLVIKVKDNGKGMDAQTARKARDPFFTSRTTRKVGLGIPLLAAAAERCGGSLKINSLPGKGTEISASFIHSHIDRAPIGNMWDTVSGLIACNEDVDFIYTHVFNGNTFKLDTRDIKKILKEVPITSPEVIGWIRDRIKDGIN
ncbi:MAG TPA: ATP-binding protein, partial [Clostridiaceae bacterium]|nr:ATP-binding protein [Clostridiaceae bacterium]